jgi:hypothetical protein
MASCTPPWPRAGAAHGARCGAISEGVERERMMRPTLVEPPDVTIEIR